MPVLSPHKRAAVLPCPGELPIYALQCVVRLLCGPLPVLLPYMALSLVLVQVLVVLHVLPMSSRPDIAPHLSALQH